jgi:CheY-like chemotaxis protein
MIFLIEDEPDIRESLREVLEMEGYEVCCASNGLEATKLLRDLPTPELILLDMLMPMMNGKEFRDWQLDVPRLKSVPVIVLSADPSQKELDGILHLQKPVDLGELLAAVKGSTLKDQPA